MPLLHLGNNTELNGPSAEGWVVEGVAVGLYRWASWLRGAAIVTRDDVGNIISYEQVPAFVTPPRDAEVVEGAWDHDHCSACWDSINPRDPTARTGHFWLGVNSWICTLCHFRITAWLDTDDGRAFRATCGMVAPGEDL